MFINDDLRRLGFVLLYGIPNDIPSIYCKNTTNIQDYYKEPYDIEFNREVVDDIESERNSRFFEPLTFLNFVYHQAKFVLDRSPEKMVRHMDELLINRGQRQLLYKHLVNLMNLEPLKLKAIFFRVSFHKDWKISVKRLEYELNILIEEFKLAEQKDLLLEKYDWDRISSELKQIESLCDKIVYLKNLKYDYLQDCENADESLDYLNILPQCEIELKRFKELFDFENENVLTAENRRVNSILREEIKEEKEGVKVNKISTENENNFDNNPYPEIFSGSESWELFRDYMSEANQSEIIREASFIYRMMCEKENQALIHKHIKPGMYRDWFNSHLEEFHSGYLAEVKTFDYSISDHRKNRYFRIKRIVFKSTSM